MKTCMDKDFIVTRSLCAMMKKFLTKHLALQYTAARKCRNKDPNLKKEIFKNTTLCKRMFSKYYILKNRIIIRLIWQ